MPAGSRKIKDAGFRLLGETLSDEELADVAPFIFSAVAPKSKISELKQLVEKEKTWAVVVPENFSVEDLKNKAAGLEILGSPTRYEFEDAEAKSRKISELGEKIRAESRNVCRPTFRAELKNASPIPTETSSRLVCSRRAASRSPA